MSAQPYTPVADSVAARCVAYFRRLPDEELSTKDVALKFSVEAKHVLSLLQDAVEADLLALDGNIYSAGKQINAADAPPPTTNVFGARLKTPTAQAKAPAKRHNHVIDLAALKVDTGVPHRGRNSLGSSKWDPVLDKLQEAGQSIVLPAHLKAAAASAAHKRNKEKRGTYRVGLDAAGHLRIWRTA